VAVESTVTSRHSRAAVNQASDRFADSAITNRLRTLVKQELTYYD
jgi:hypothetical protein